MRKPAICICGNKDADQLRGNREADQRLCFRYIDNTIPLLLKYENFKSLAIFCGCAALFVLDLVGTPEDRFSHNEAHIISLVFVRNFKCLASFCSNEGMFLADLVRNLKMGFLATTGI